MDEKKSLSASSIKCIETCTWMYYQQYVQKVPQKTNEGALRGTIVHLIFELLLNVRHRNHYNLVVNANNIEGSPALQRLIIKHMKRVDILTTTNYDMLNQMILVGLHTDFFGKGGTLGEPEFRFELYNENPEYRIRGYIDKLIFYEDGRIKIVDYKSSKSKFKGDDLTANIQSMAYSLAGYKIFGATDVTSEFIFLRFPRQPVQEVHLTKEQLKGFESYLAHMYQLINNFDENRAKDNMAAYSEKNRWLCKAGKWTCPYMTSFKYYALVDENDKVARTNLKKEDLKPEPGQKMKIMYYEGCAAFKKQTNTSGEL